MAALIGHAPTGLFGLAPHSACVPSRPASLSLSSLFVSSRSLPSLFTLFLHHLSSSSSLQRGLFWRVSAAPTAPLCPPLPPPPLPMLSCLTLLALTLSPASNWCARNSSPSSLPLPLLSPTGPWLEAAAPVQQQPMSRPDGAPTRSMEGEWQGYASSVCSVPAPRWRLMR